MVLTFLPVSATLHTMNSTLKTGSGMFSACAGRGRPWCAEKRFLVNSLLVCATAVTAAPVEWVRGGKPVAKLYHAPLAQTADSRVFDPKVSVAKGFAALSAEDQDAKCLANALDDLNDHLQKMSGARLEVVVTDDPLAVQAPGIVVGTLAGKLGGDPTRHAEFPEAFRIKSGGGLVLVAGRSDLGSAYGLYELLNQLGCDWVMPGDEGESIPRRDTVAVAEQDAEFAPAWNLRYSWYGGYCRSAQARFEFDRWKLRMRQQLVRRDEFPIGGHSWGNLIREFKAEFDADPTMLALRRDASGNLTRGGVQIETTHPKVIELGVQYIRQQFEKNAWPKDKRVCIPMGPSDGGGVSESAESVAAGSGRISPDSGKPDGTDHVVLFLNTLLEKTKDDFPNLHLGFYLYSWHADYPVKVKPDPRVAIEIADINLSRFHGIGDTSSKSRYYYKNVLDLWGKLHREQGSVMYYRPYSWNLADGYLPFTKLKIWGEEFPYFHKLNVSGILLNLYNDWAINGPHTYLAVRLSWDPTLDWKQVLRHYCEKAYGKGADAMERHFLAMTERQSKAGQEAGCVYAYPLIYDDAFIDEMDLLFAEAAKQAEMELERKRIAYAHLPLEHLRKYLAFRREVNALDLPAARQTYQAIIDGIHTANVQNVQIVGQQGLQFIDRFFQKFLAVGITNSTGDYSIVYKIPDRLKTALDREVQGEQLNYQGTDINDTHYFTTQTFGSTWDAQGLGGYRKGAVWYRIPFTLPAKAENYGLFVGGVDNQIRVWCNGRFVGFGSGGLTTPHVFDLTDAVKPGEENLLAFQVIRVGNFELGTGGIMLPCFVFKGPRVERVIGEDERPFRMLPGGIVDRSD
jgi:hypothetical protein